MPVDQLTKLYVELTTACNLDCVMCVRRTWKDEGYGPMRWELYQQLMEQLSEFPQPPTIHFGGYGEPMTYPWFLEAIELAKSIGAPVEMTTNGTLLTPDFAQALIDLNVDKIMVSIDGVSPEVYGDIRVHSDFRQVVSNFIELFRRKVSQRGRGLHKPIVGISFVAMKRNIADLGKLPQLAHQIGASEIKVSNVVPYYPQLADEILYDRALYSLAYRSSPAIPDMSLPKMNLDETTVPALMDVFDSTVTISWKQSALSKYNDYCEFTQQGYAVIRRDGAVAPCLELMRDHTVYLLGRPQHVTHYTLGNITEQSLREIWESPEYSDFRRRVREFPYSPCLTCGGCERFEENYQDCNENNVFPVCGRCPWAQGFVQCP